MTIYIVWMRDLDLSYKMMGWFLMESNAYEYRDVLADKNPEVRFFVEGHENMDETWQEKART